MAIQTAIRKSGVFAGDGSQTSFPFGFKVFSKTDVLVVVADDAEERVAQYGADYDVSLQVDQEMTPGGEVRLKSPLKSGEYLVISSAMSNLQPAKFTNHGGFYPTVLNDSLDRLTILIQQLDERLGRAVLFGMTSGNDFQATLPLPKPNEGIGWNETGDKLVNTRHHIEAQQASKAAAEAMVSAEQDAGRAEAARDRAQSAAVEAESLVQSKILAGEERISTADNAVLTGIYVTSQGVPTDGTEYTVKAVVSGNKVYQSAENGSDGVPYYRVLNTDTGHKSTWENRLVRSDDLFNPAHGKGVDLLAGAVKQVETVAAMLEWAAAVPPAAGKSVQVAGYRKAGDGGGGVFVYDPAKAGENDGGMVLDGWVRLGVQYATPEMFGAQGGGLADAAPALQKCLDSPNVETLNLQSGKYLLGSPLVLKGNKHIFSDGAELTCNVSLAGDAPYRPRALLTASGISGLRIEGAVKCRINHLLFKPLGDAANKPVVVALLADGCSNCDFGLIDAAGAANYYTAPDFMEYGIVDMRSCTDCLVRVNVDGGYGRETVDSAPSTVGVLGMGNTRCTVSGMVANTYWSGILWDGTDCKVIHPVVRNTKGSNLNLSGTNTNAYDVDLKQSQQGNVSIGEGADTCYACGVYGGDIGDAKYANVALHNSARNCRVEADIYGWGQHGTKNEATVGVRVRGLGNIIKVSAKAQRGGKRSVGDAVSVVSDTLDTPNTADTVLDVDADGAGIVIRAPRTTVEASVGNAPGNAVSMGYRCAGSVVKYVKALKCLRALYYEPNPADPADYAGVQIGTITSVDCTNEPVLSVTTTGRLYSSAEDFYPQSRTVKNNELMGGMRSYTADSRLSAYADKLAAGVTFVSQSDSGGVYGVNITTSAVSGGGYKKAVHSFSHNSLELASLFGGSHVVCKSPDGTRYKLEPPNGGGPATWVRL